MYHTLRIAAVLLLSWNATAAEIEPPALSLANVYHDNVDLEAYWVSEKLDGVRAWWDGESLYSRQGNRFNAPAAFVEGFPKAALDGELWMGRGTFERLSGIVRRTATQEDVWRGVRYMVFDLPGHAGTFDQRLARLKELLSTAETSRIGLVEQFRIADESELMAVLDRIVAGGGEGLMLRKGDSYYRRGRSDDLLKLSCTRMPKPWLSPICQAGANMPACSARSWSKCPMAAVSSSARDSPTKCVAAHLPSALRSRTSTTARPGTAYRASRASCGLGPKVKLGPPQGPGRSLNRRRPSPWGRPGRGPTQTGSHRKPLPGPGLPGRMRTHRWWPLCRRRNT